MGKSRGPTIIRTMTLGLCSPLATPILYYALQVDLVSIRSCNPRSHRRLSDDTAQALANSFTRSRKRSTEGWINSGGAGIGLRMQPVTMSAHSRNLHYGITLPYKRICTSGGFCTGARAAESTRRNKYPFGYSWNELVNQGRGTISCQNRHPYPNPRSSEPQKSIATSSSCSPIAAKHACLSRSHAASSRAGLFMSFVESF